MKFCQLFLLLIVFNIYGQKQNQFIGFIENKGQIVDQKGRKNNVVKYLLNTNGLNVQLRKNGFSYDVYETKKHPLTKKQKERLYPSNSIKEDTLKNPNYTLEYLYHRIDIDFENSNQSVKLIAEEKSSDYDNYYNVPDEPNGITNVHKFQKVTYKNIYNNIDVVFFIPKDESKPVEYNFIVNEGGKISDIQLKFNGVKTELIDNKIKMNVRFGQMEETLPLSWSENGTAKNEIAIGYKKIKNNIYGFESSEDLNNKKVVIDPVPVRLWGTLYGDKTNNYYSLGTVNNTIDSYGNLYMSGSTSASNSSFATAGAHQTYIPTSQYLCTNGIIVKFDPNGTRLWGTYYGGINYNDIRGIKADSQNNIVIAGQTQSPTNISTVGSHQQNNQGGTDAYIVKFNELGVRIWGTYLGGNNDDFAFGLDIDNLNNIYIVGGTSSSSGIAYNSNFQSQLFQSSSGYGDAFIAKFDSTGTIIWSTYAGGESFESFNAVVVKNNQIVAVGSTRSDTNIATNGVFQQSIYPNGQIDGMIYKFSNNGNRLWSSYYGGDNIEEILSVEIDDDDNIYIGGQTASTFNMTTPGSFQFSSPELYKGFLAKLSTIGARVWGSYLDDLVVYSIIFKNNSIYLGATGNSNNQNLTNPCSFNRNLNSESLGYIGKFSKNCEFIWGTFLGGDAMNGGFVIDYATKLSIDNSNNIYVSGITSSNNLITDSNSHQQNMVGLLNYYSMKFLENSPTVINVSSNSPTCIGGNLNLTANGGTNYSWSGPNGFTSNQQNPTITSVNSTHSGLYSCMITGSSSCDGIKTVNVIVEDTTKPIPNSNPLPTITGDCTTTISTPTATDNCAGTITASTSDPLSYSLPGYYTIHWNYNDGNGNIETQTQNVSVTNIALPMCNSPQIFCIKQNATLNSIPITGLNIKWYDAITAGNLLLNSTLLQHGITYYASQTVNGCESLRNPVSINIENTSAPTGTGTQTFCSTQNATLSDISILGTNINWYNSPTSSSVLTATTILTNGTTYYASQTINGCESSSRLPIKIILISTLNATDYSEIICDDLNDGNETIDLSNYNLNVISNTTNCTFEYYPTLLSATNQVISQQINPFTNYNLTIGLHDIYVRIISNTGCSQIVKLSLTLVKKPEVVLKDIIPICENNPITINAGAGFNSYSWSTGATTQSITIPQAGNYSVTVTQNHGSITCASTKNFTVVLSNSATIATIETQDWTDNENIIIVNLTVSSIGNYEYSLDGIHYQNSNIFSGLYSGNYTVYVHDKNECGIATEDVFLLTYPKFFTPNGDENNDTWKIKFSQYEPGLKVKIFDRYGKQIKSLENNSSWDGTYNGELMLSDDYWFVVSRANGKEHKGHFTLKR
jgi:gliding motility-associated-like protein